MWRLLLVAELGITAAATLACMIPLYSRAATAAGLEDALVGHPSTNTLNVLVSTNQPSLSLRQLCEQQVTAVAADQLRAYHVGGPSAFELMSQPVKLAPSTGHSSDAFSLTGLPSGQITREARVIEGRLPRPQPGHLEIAVTPTTATALNLRIGSSLVLAGAVQTAQASNAAASPAPLALQVVGLIRRVSTGGSTLEPSPLYASGGPNATRYQALASADALLEFTYPWDALDQAVPFSGAAGQPQAMWNLNWTYPLDLSHLSEGDVNALLSGDPQRTSALLTQVFDGVPQAQSGFLDSNVFNAIANYSRRTIAGEIVVTVLLVEAIGLILLFIALVSGSLIEQQGALIATLRSRGASRWQIATTFTLQSLALGGVAAVAGPLLAIPLSHLTASLLFPPEGQHALSVLDGNPIEVAVGTLGIALIVAGGIVLTLVWAAHRAAALDILALRRETTRMTHKPLWQRFYLDVAAALFAFAGYGSFFLVNQLAGATTAADSNQLRLALSPLSLLAPIFLTIATALLFFRSFPLLLRLGARVSARGRGSSSVLALTQLARAPRPAMQTALLLALTIGFAVFTVSASATLEQHARNAAGYQAGADLSGALAAAGSGQQELAARTDAYMHVPGVISATLGLRTSTPIQRSASPLSTGATIQLEAVDADTFAHTAIWSAQDSTQRLSDLTALLRSHREDAASRHVVYAVVDATVWDTLHLSSGSSFTLPVPGYSTGGMRFIAAARVPHIPSLYSTLGGGILVDYQSYAIVYSHDTSAALASSPAFNFAWLRTMDDAASVASARAAVREGPLQLTDLQPEDGAQIPFTDRRSMMAALVNDPVYLDLRGILSIAAATALALALFGTWISAWQYMRGQETATVLLSALGMERKRIVAFFLWEQGIIDAASLLLGAAVGAILVEIMLPALPDLVFSSNFGGAVLDGGNAVQIVYPWLALILTGASLCLISGLAAVLSARLAARPSPGQNLRLNED